MQFVGVKELYCNTSDVSQLPSIGYTLCTGIRESYTVVGVHLKYSIVYIYFPVRYGIVQN